MKASICGIGVVGGFGNGPAALEKALSGARVPVTQVSIETRQGSIQVPCLVADSRPLADYVSSRVLRRMGHYIRLAQLAAFGAMADAGLLDKGKRERMGIIVATGNGPTGNNYEFQFPFKDKDELCRSPIRFSNSVNNAAAAYLSIALEEMGPNLSITHDDISFPSALLTAVTWLQERRVDAVLVGGVDELSHAHAYAWHVHHQRIEADGDAFPIAGEGACFFVLKRAEADAAPYGVVQEVVVGRVTADLLSRPAGDLFILGKGGAAATRAEYKKWVPLGARTACYGHLYGDLAIDTAFDTAIAALSIKNNRVYSMGSPVSPSQKPEPLVERSIVCLKLGVGNTYGWTVLGLPDPIS